MSSYPRTGSTCGAGIGGSLEALELEMEPKPTRSMRAPMDFGLDIVPAGVSERTRSPSSVTLDATIRRPFFSTMVSAAAEDTTSSKSDARGAAWGTPEFYQVAQTQRALLPR